MKFSLQHYCFCKLVLPRVLFLLITLLNVCFVTVAQPTNGESNRKALDRYIGEEMQREHIPGLAYTVVLNGKMADSGTYGLADIEQGTTVTLHTIFPIGSIGKSFTATAIMLLQKQGKLSIDDPVNKFINSVPENWRKITLRNLLTHTSGIRDYLNNFPGYTAIEDDDPSADITENDFLNMLKKYPPNFQPGERFAYCNAGFVLLGFIVEKVSGLSLADFLHRQLFEPLGMNETSYVNREKIKINRAAGYNLDEDNTLINGMYISDFYSSLGDMGIMTSINDMIKWSKALDQGKIPGKELVDEMWSPGHLNDGTQANSVFGSYGLGWLIEDYRGYRMIGHNGSFGAGYSAEFIHFPEKNLYVIVMCNLNRANTRWIAIHIAGTIFPQLRALDELIPDNKEDTLLTKKINAFFEWLHGNASDSNNITPAYRRSINPVMKQVFPANVDLGFHWIRCDSVDHRLFRNGMRVNKIAYYHIQVMGQDHYLSFYFTEDNRITDVMGY